MSCLKIPCYPGLNKNVANLAAFQQLACLELFVVDSGGVHDALGAFIALPNLKELSVFGPFEFPPFTIDDDDEALDENEEELVLAQSLKKLKIEYGGSLGQVTTGMHGFLDVLSTIGHNLTHIHLGSDTSSSFSVFRCIGQYCQQLEELIVEENAWTIFAFCQMVPASLRRLVCRNISLGQNSLLALTQCSNLENLAFNLVAPIPLDILNTMRQKMTALAHIEVHVDGVDGDLVPVTHIRELLYIINKFDSIKKFSLFGKNTRALSTWMEKNYSKLKNDMKFELSWSFDFDHASSFLT